MFFYGTHETANLKSDESKVCDDEEHEKEGYQEGLLEIEEKHQNAAVQAVWVTVSLFIPRIE